MQTFQVSSVLMSYGMPFFLGLFIAPFIYIDAKKLPKLFLNTSPRFWALCAPFLGPLWTVLIYWAIHHSSFSNREVFLPKPSKRNRKYSSPTNRK
ncbi:hypothetical protein EDC56_3719 [Sinobacterium caligoides]|uniref:Uncharacterized protein n=1 Tax=Sinobacterium caligoides TaxID=933926 RepID=A0A3N2D525_9GAMM|nr:hypothetical protein EDC56_3719 [Sinobacterium caligoides]